MSKWSGVGRDQLLEFVEAFEKEAREARTLASDARRVLDGMRVRERELVEERDDAVGRVKELERELAEEQGHSRRLLDALLKEKVAAIKKG